MTEDIANQEGVIDTSATDIKKEENFTFSVETSSEIQAPVIPTIEEIVPPKQDEIVPKETDVEDEVEYECIEIEDEDYEELNEDLAFKFLKDKKGLTAENIDELLTPK